MFGESSKSLVDQKARIKRRGSFWNRLSSGGSSQPCFVCVFLLIRLSYLAFSLPHFRLPALSFPVLFVLICSRLFTQLAWHSVPGGGSVAHGPGGGAGGIWLLSPTFWITRMGDITGGALSRNCLIPWRLVLIPRLACFASSFKQTETVRLSPIYKGDCGETTPKNRYDSPLFIVVLDGSGDGGGGVV